MTTRPRVDVGIVCWNTRDLTIDAIGRLLEASDDVDLHVLVRDNGSTDGTAQALRGAFPDVDVQVGHNVGFAAGVNTLLARSDAPWFLALNSDAWPEPGAVRTLLEAAAQRPRAAVLAPTLLRPDGTLEVGVHPLPSLRGAGRRPLPPAAGPREVGWAVGAALLLRREAWQSLGGFDERLFMYAEDLDLCWRARQAGWQVWEVPGAVVRHVGNASGAQRYGRTRERAVIANANRVVRRHLGGPRAVAWQVLNAAGAARAGARRDADLRRFWWSQVPDHLGLRRSRPVDPQR